MVVHNQTSNAPSDGRDVITVLQMRVMAGSAVLAAALVVAGCSSGGGSPEATAPVSSSSTTASSSVSPSPGPSASAPDPAAPALPELPAAATTADAAGAEAFVRHFWDVVNYAYATGDTDPVLAISDEGCGACQSLVDNVLSVTDAGGSWVGMAWVTSDYLADAPNAEGVSLVSGLRQPAKGASVVLADGSTSMVSEAGPVDFQILAVQSGQSWRLQAIGSFADGSAS